MRKVSAVGIALVSVLLLASGCSSTSGHRIPPEIPSGATFVGAGTLFDFSSPDNGVLLVFDTDQKVIVKTKYLAKAGKTTAIRGQFDDETQGTAIDAKLEFYFLPEWEYYPAAKAHSGTAPDAPAGSKADAQPDAKPDSQPDSASEAKP